MIPFSDYFLIAGAGLILIASLGILRMPDLYLRMHASAKAGTLGAGLVLGGAVLFFADWLVAIELLMAIFFLILTAPVRIPEDLITDSGRHLITDSGVFDHFNDSRPALSLNRIRL